MRMTSSGDVAASQCGPQCPKTQMRVFLAQSCKCRSSKFCTMASTIPLSTRY